jgi:hypothetical protein
MQETSMKQADGDDKVPPKYLSTFTGLPDVVFQKMKLVIVTAVRVSNPTQE